VKFERSIELQSSVVTLIGYNPQKAPSYIEGAPEPILLISSYTDNILAYLNKKCNTNCESVVLVCNGKQW
jgi:hypothetical protein